MTNPALKKRYKNHRMPSIFPNSTSFVIFFLFISQSVDFLWYNSRINVLVVSKLASLEAQSPFSSTPWSIVFPSQLIYHCKFTLVIPSAIKTAGEMQVLIFLPKQCEPPSSMSDTPVIMIKRK